MLNKILAIEKKSYDILKKIESIDSNNLDKNDFEEKNNDIAVIKINGVISRGNGIVSWMMGGSDVDDLMYSFDSAINNKSIKGILLYINSVGGDVDGVPEFAEMIYNSRNIKPIYAYVGYIGASAGYWIASAAEKIFIHESASVGSIGVMAEFYSGNNGEQIVISSVSPLKNIDPNTSEGLSNLQRQVDELGLIFVSNVAKYRGISIEEVVNNYGKGDIMISYNAIKAGMVDGIENLKSVLAKFNKTGEKMSLMSKFKSQDEKNPQELDAPQGIPVEEIDSEWLKSNKADLVRQIQEEGAQSERDRIKSLCDTEEIMPEEEKEESKNAFYSAKFESPKAKNDLLSELFTKRQQNLAKIKENIIKDAAQIPNIASIDIEKEEEKLKKMAIEAAKKKFGGKK